MNLFVVYLLVFVYCAHALHFRGHNQFRRHRPIAVLTDRGSGNEVITSANTLSAIVQQLEVTQSGKSKRNTDRNERAKTNEMTVASKLSLHDAVSKLKQIPDVSNDLDKALLIRKGFESHKRKPMPLPNKKVKQSSKIPQNNTKKSSKKIVSHNSNKYSIADVLPKLRVGHVVAAEPEKTIEMNMLSCLKLAADTEANSISSELSRDKSQDVTNRGINNVLKKNPIVAKSNFELSSFTKHIRNSVSSEMELSTDIISVDRPNEEAVLLANPSVLVSYNITKAITELKKQLLGLQDEWREQSQQNAESPTRDGRGWRDSSSSRDSSSGAGNGIAGKKSFSFTNYSPRDYASKKKNQENWPDKQYAESTKSFKRKPKAKQITQTIKSLTLPSSGLIDIVEFAELIDIGVDKIVKYAVEKLGLIIREDNLVEVTDIARILSWLTDETKLSITYEFKDSIDEDDASNGQPSSVISEVSKEPTTTASKSATDTVALMPNTAVKQRMMLRSISKNLTGHRRSPIVSIMGHVDHGKTTLLDQIRKTDVASSEAGGITQKVTAFSVLVPAAVPAASSDTNERYEHSTNSLNEQENRITFIDTPGHAIFRQMRGRGANVTDIIVLVVAADDGIKEQTIECINAAKASGAAIIVAINKIDLPTANIRQVKIDLMQHDIVVEEFGGAIQCALVSGLTGIGVNELLEKIALESEVLELTAPLDIAATGTVLDGNVDKRQGITGTLLIQQGALKTGDILIAGNTYAKVKKMFNDRGDIVKFAKPSVPIKVSGFNEIPQSGEKFTVVENESTAKKIIEARNNINTQSSAVDRSLVKESLLLSAQKLLTADQSDSTATAVNRQDDTVTTTIPLVIKADSTSSIEALDAAIEQLSVRIDQKELRKFSVVSSGVGDISASDISLASTNSQASKSGVVVGFNVGTITGSILNTAKSNSVKVLMSSVIYDIINELTEVLSKTDSPPLPGILLGRASVLKVFKTGKGGKVAGCVVKEGLFSMVPKANSESSEHQQSGSSSAVVKVRVIRNKKVIVFVGELSTLRIEKKIVTEVFAGSECGIAINKFIDFEEGDTIECYETTETDNAVDAAAESPSVTESTTPTA